MRMLIDSENVSSSDLIISAIYELIQMEILSTTNVVEGRYRCLEIHKGANLSSSKLSDYQELIIEAFLKDEDSEIEENYTIRNLFSSTVEALNYRTKDFKRLYISKYLIKNSFLKLRIFGFPRRKYTLTEKGKHLKINVLRKLFDLNVEINKKSRFVEDLENELGLNSSLILKIEDVKKILHYRDIPETSNFKLDSTY